MAGRVAASLSQGHSCAPPEEVPPKEPTGFARDNIEWAKGRIKERGGDPIHEDWVIDCDASERWRTYKKDHSPCLINARAQGLWITSRQRRLTAEETFKLQGLAWPRLPGDTDAELRAMAGNAMTVPVVESLVGSIAACIRGFESTVRPSLAVGAAVASNPVENIKTSSRDSRFSIEKFRVSRKTLKE